jgi:hypothetical protein
VSHLHLATGRWRYKAGRYTGLAGAMNVLYHMFNTFAN